MTEAGQPGEGASEETEHEQHIQYLEQYRRRLDGAMFAGDLSWWEMDVETGMSPSTRTSPICLGFHRRTLTIMRTSLNSFILTITRGDGGDAGPSRRTG